MQQPAKRNRRLMSADPGVNSKRYWKLINLTKLIAFLNIRIIESNRELWKDYFTQIAGPLKKKDFLQFPVASVILILMFVFTHSKLHPLIFSFRAGEENVPHPIRL